MTEVEFFRGLKAACQNPRVTIEIGDQHGVPLTLARLASELKKRAIKRAKAADDSFLAYNSVWCVFDIDEHPNVPEACDCASDNQINCAISNPCFEIWLLLHYREPPGASHRDKIVEMLREFDPDYEKHVDFKKSPPGYDAAVKRAGRLRNQAIATKTLLREQNPSTSVHDLTELIIRGPER